MNSTPYFPLIQLSTPLFNHNRNESVKRKINLLPRTFRFLTWVHFRKSLLFDSHTNNAQETVKFFPFAKSEQFYSGKVSSTAVMCLWFFVQIIASIEFIRRKSKKKHESFFFIYFFFSHRNLLNKIILGRLWLLIAPECTFFRPTTCSRKKNIYNFIFSMCNMCAGGGSIKRWRLSSFLVTHNLK